MSSDEVPADGDVDFRTLASADGRYVAFTSSADNLGGSHQPPGTGMSEDVYVRDRVAGTTTMVSTLSPGVGAGARLVDFSADGGHVLMLTLSALTADDTDETTDLYLLDLQSDTYTLVSQAPGWRADVEVSLFASASHDGSTVAFLANAQVKPGRKRDYYDVYVRHLSSGRTELVSATRSGRPGGGRLPQISANGRFVAFDSKNADLVRSDTNGKRDVFVRDVLRNRTERVSVSSRGRQGNRGLENGLRISDDGRFVAFTSEATNLARHDTNRAPDVFVHDRKRDATRRVSVSTRGKQAERGAWLNEMSASGRLVLFRTRSHLGGPRNASAWDHYVRDHEKGRTEYLAAAPDAVVGSIADQGWLAFTTQQPLVPQDSGLGPDVYFARFR